MALTASLIDVLWSGLFNTSGAPLAGGKVYIYQAGTANLATNIYTDANSSVQSANPVTLDSYGRASIFGSGVYKIVVKDSAGVTIAYPALDNFIVQPTSSVGLPNFISSVVNASGNVSLVNDSTSPGNSYYYGTNGSGAKGFFQFTTGSLVLKGNGAGGIANAVANVDYTPAATVALTDGATIATDASLGSVFTVVLGGNRTLAAPSNPTNGQRCIWRFTQDATGSRTITLDAAFTFGTDITGVTLSTAANKTDYMGGIYNGITSKWNVVCFVKGY